MNTWIFKMVTWHRRFALEAERLTRAPGRVYWDRRTRTWNLTRNQSYALVEARRQGSMFRSKPKW